MNIRTHLFSKIRTSDDIYVELFDFMTEESGKELIAKAALLQMEKNKTRKKAEANRALLVLIPALVLLAAALIAWILLGKNSVTALCGCLAGALVLSAIVLGVVVANRKQLLNFFMHEYDGRIYDREALDYYKEKNIYMQNKKQVEILRESTVVDVVIGINTAIIRYVVKDGQKLQIEVGFEKYVGSDESFGPNFIAFYDDMVVGRTSSSSDGYVYKATTSLLR